jgi:hypothetical protein
MFSDGLDFTVRRAARFKSDPAPAPKPSVNWPELIRRGVSHVRVDGCVYRVEVKPYGVVERG